MSLASKISRKYAMKTGSSGTDYWMIGYNPDALMLVWNGYDDNKEVTIKDNLISKNIWVETMENYLSDKNSQWYEKPDNVIAVPLDSITGKEPKDQAHTFIFYFNKGSEDSKESLINKETVTE